MDCLVFQWLFAGAGPTTLQHALVGIGCVLALDAMTGWRRRRPAKQAMPVEPAHDDAAEPETYRRAA